MTALQKPTPQYINTENIYHKYGGYDFFHKIIHELYEDLFDHPEISFHFLGVDIDYLSRMQTLYLAEAIGAGDVYNGKPLNIVHANMGITAYQFKLVGQRFRRVFIKNGLNKDEVDYIMKFVLSHNKDIVTAKDALIDKIMRPIYKVLYFFRGIYRKAIKYKIPHYEKN